MAEFQTGFEKAWNWRESRGYFEGGDALRVFHGPGEGMDATGSLAIDRFGSHYWITKWAGGARADSRLDSAIEKFLREKGANSAVILERPEKGVPEQPRVLFGNVPPDRFAVSEGPTRFWIQLQDSRHPGLFLDHLPLRQWLNQRARNLRVLNTFAYTGSLSVAAAFGGAAQVTTLDLSNPTVRWAEENFKLNGLPVEGARFIAGDVFEWLPRLKRQGEKYDCVILDPPSFSRGQKKNFSTAKDLVFLHELALDLLNEGGYLVTSINSATLSATRFEGDVMAAAKSRKARLQTLMQLQQPETFPSIPGDPESRYLKGFIFRKV